MDNVLAITAELKRCSIAVLYDGSLFEVNESVDAPAHLAELLEVLIADNDVDLNKIRKLVTASGPGSFTGIRTAHSLVKGLSLSLNIPAFCTDYFGVIKLMFNRGDKIVSVIQSAKNQVYFKDFSTGIFGVSSYAELDAKTSKGLPFAGDFILEISNNKDHAFTEIKNFRDAKHLLQISGLSSTVKPLYVNAQT